MKRAIIVVLSAIVLTGCAAHSSNKAIWEPKTKQERMLAEQERQENREEMCRENTRALKKADKRWKISESIFEGLWKGTAEVLTGIPVP